MIVTHKITVDLTRGGEMPRVDVVQGDVNTRAVELTLLEGGMAFAVPSGTAAAVRFRKADGTGGVYNTMPDGSLAYSVKGNVVTVFLVPQLMTCPGGVTAEVALSNNGEVLGVFPMRIWVEHDPSVGTVESENYFSFDSLESINAAMAGYSSAVDSLRLGDETLAKEIAVERARINTFTQLKDGSTTADAELIDIRVGYDGTAHANAGEAVRDQAGQLHDALYRERTEYLVHPETWESMTTQSNASWWASNKRFPHGTVKGISLFIMGEEKQNYTVMFCKDNGDGTASFITQVTGTGVGHVDMACDIYMEEDFYVALKAPCCAYREVTNGGYYTQYITGVPYQIPDATDTKYYHAFALRMLPFVHEKADAESVKNLPSVEAEMQDIRTGIHNVTYPSAGEAVREQMESILGDLYGSRREFLVHPDLWKSMTQKSGDGNWATSKKYKRGTVKAVSLYILGDTAQSFNVMFCKDNGDGTASWYANVSGNGVGLVNVECDVYMDRDFYVVIKAPNCAYRQVSDGSYYSKTVSSGTFTVPDDSGSKYYHAYSLTMASFADDKMDAETLQEIYAADAAVLGKTIKVAEEIISGSTQYADAMALPCNRIYNIQSSVDNVTFGLPVKGNGTLLKYRPFTDDRGDRGFVVYDFTVLNGSRVEKYFAFSIVGDTVDTLIWHKHNTAETVPGIAGLGLEDKSIVFIGDSIVEGYGSSDHNGGENGTSGHLIENNIKTYYRNTGAKCWVNRMIAYLTEHYPGVTACNNGIGGFTTAAVYNNLETLTLDDSGNRADVVILSVGTNNRNAADKVVSIVTPLKRTINWLLQRHIQPIILTNTPLFNTTDAAHADNVKNAQVIRSAILQACRETGVLCYDLLSDFYCYLWEHDMDVSKNTIMADALHPNDLGYGIMFRLIKRLLRV